jgi:hypothetical protein
MKIVVDIPRKYYEDFKLQLPVLNKEAPSGFAKYAIATGTPLSTGYYTRVADGIYQCSNCKKYSGSITEYCAICGAKMILDT